MNEQDFDKIYPPTSEQIEDIRTHNVGAALRYAAKLDRPFEDWEWDIFKIRPEGKVYDVVALPNGRFGIA